MKQYLTKSAFTTGMSCLTKLYYTQQPCYVDANQEDPFMEELAKGGFQVGTLAQYYYHHIPHQNLEGNHDKEKAWQQTKELLAQYNEIALFEPAVKHDKLFAKIDILHKKGDHLRLVEVKAKSIDPERDDLSHKSWNDYTYDVAFQYYILQQAFPQYRVSPYLCLANKRQPATVDGLNQAFALVENNGQWQIQVAPSLQKEDLGEPVLYEANVQEVVNAILDKDDFGQEADMNFGEWVHTMADIYTSGQRVWQPVNSACFGCEFQVNDELEVEGHKSGFKECWHHWKGWTEKEFNKPKLTAIWNFRRKGRLMDEEGRYFMDELKQADIGFDDRADRLSSKARQWLQVQKTLQQDDTEYFDAENYGEEAAGWTYPLNMIDFETSMVALPFHKDRTPYEQIAFQFSHHLIHEDGSIEHANQYLNFEKGRFPNFDFVRALKQALEQNNGTIFRYAPHENTVLNQIREQLMNSQEPDREELIAWIEHVTYHKEEGNKKVAGNRNMVDMAALVKRYYYHPAMGGSNSIKAVLPAVIKASARLQEKYSKPVYGTSAMPSLNFDHKAWLGNTLDPYKNLPPVFDAQFEHEHRYYLDDNLNEGGKAMMAYAKMQYTHISEAERKALYQSLLKYCELDTLAMVMIWEHWDELLQQG